MLAFHTCRKDELDVRKTPGKHLHRAGPTARCIAESVCKNDLCNVIFLEEDNEALTVHYTAAVGWVGEMRIVPSLSGFIAFRSVQKQRL